MHRWKGLSEVGGLMSVSNRLRIVLLEQLVFAMALRS